MGNLRDHAMTEMQLVGLDSPDADYGPMIYECVLQLVDTFEKQGHSGLSARTTLDIFNRVASFDVLSPIGARGESEWMEVGNGIWQNRRKSTCFSEDGGKTWWDIDNMSRWWKVKRWFKRFTSH